MTFFWLGEREIERLTFEVREETKIRCQICAILILSMRRSGRERRSRKMRVRVEMLQDLFLSGVET